MSDKGIMLRIHALYVWAKWNLIFFPLGFIHENKTIFIDIGWSKVEEILIPGTGQSQSFSFLEKLKS